VIDSADVDRLAVSKTELVSMLEEEELRGVPLLVLANKQDLPGAASEVTLSESLGLTGERDRPWSLYKTSALSGEGLADALDWYANGLLFKPDIYDFPL
jgi:ADP-ribosylation factor-like protein 1